MKYSITKTHDKINPKKTTQPCPSNNNNQKTYGFQSFYIPTVAPGTYRPFYDGDHPNNEQTSGNTWDTDHPVGTNPITMRFTPHGNLSDALVTITQTGQLIFGEAPKILINRVEDDNGASASDMVYIVCKYTKICAQTCESFHSVEIWIFLGSYRPISFQNDG